MHRTVLRELAWISKLYNSKREPAEKPGDFWNSAEAPVPNLVMSGTGLQPRKLLWASAATRAKISPSNNIAHVLPIAHLQQSVSRGVTVFLGAALP